MTFLHQTRCWALISKCFNFQPAFVIYFSISLRQFLFFDRPLFLLLILGWGELLSLVCGLSSSTFLSDPLYNCVFWILLNMFYIPITRQVLKLVFISQINISGSSANVNKFNIVIFLGIILANGFNVI